MKNKLIIIFKLVFGFLLYLVRSRKKIDKTTTTYKKFKKDGIVILEQKISENVCKAIRDNIFELRKRNNEDIKSMFDNCGSDYRVYGYENISGNLSVLLIEQIKTEILDMIIPTKKGSYILLASNVRYVKNNKGSGGGWHRDSISEQYKMMIYLNDVDKDNGPFEYLKGSHKFICKFKSLFNNLHSFKRFKNKEIEKFSSYGKVQCTGLTGTIILFDSTGLHRGRPLTDGQRFSITMYCFPTDDIGKFKKLLN